MRIVCVGGGAGGLYFAWLMKKADPRHHIRVIERNRPDDTFGFGVVFSDATMAGIAEADSEAYRGIARHLVHWDDIEVNYRGERITSTGHGFSGMSRHTLLRVLQEQACAAGVDVLFEREVESLDALDVLDRADLVVAADGANSTVRQLLRDRVKTTIDLRPNRFVWLGTTKPFPAFTFHFKRNDHGLWRVHAYQYGPGRSTFIVECREETWRAAGMAMEDAVALRDALVDHDTIASALAAYETRRRPQVESLQRAAQASLQWFEDTERYTTLEPIQFTFSLLTRSLRITHEDLRARDPQFLARVDEF